MHFGTMLGLFQCLGLGHGCLCRVIVYLYSLLDKFIDLDEGKMYIQSCKKTLAKRNCCM